MMNATTPIAMDIFINDDMYLVELMALLWF